ncbi:serine/threonine-protein phosphatase 7, partial [Tanacetum coccineum]
MQRSGSKVSLFRSWTVDKRVARRLEGTCFHRFIDFPLYLQKHMFLEQIARSYSKQEHTFVVGNTHLYLGLEDVYYLSGLPVDGLPIVGEATNPTSLCRRLLDGKDDPERSLTSVNLRLTWLKETFELVPQDIENEQLDVYVRAYVLFIIGTMLLSDADTVRVGIHYLQFIENLHPNSLNSYAWGAAVLARIHRSLRQEIKKVLGVQVGFSRVPSVGKAYLKEQTELTNQFPAFLEWTHLLCKPSQNRRMTIDWQQIFDNIQAEKIIYHTPEKAPLQLSIISMQEPSNAMINLKIKYRNGHIAPKLLHHYKAYIKEWCEHRYDAETCIIDTDEGFVLPNPPSEPCSAFDDSEGRAISMTKFLRLPTWEGLNEPILELIPEQLSVERPDSKAVREKDRDALNVAQRSKEATKTDSQDSGDDLEGTISDVCPLSEMGSNREDDVGRNHEDGDGEDPNSSGSDYADENSKENDNVADKNNGDGEGFKGDDGERHDDGHGTGSSDDYIPRDVTQSSFFHPENETHACLSKQASTEENFQQTLSNRQSIKRSYLYLGDSTSSYTDTLRRFEKLITDLEELVHTNDINEWEKEEYRKSLLSTSKKLEKMTVKKEEAVEKCHGLEADLASIDAHNKMLEQQLQDETESNKQQELQLKNQGKDLEEKDREIARLKVELEDAIIRAGDQEKQKQNIIRDLVPSVVTRLLQ